MSSGAKSEFFELVRIEFAPVLREMGFKGSGQHFRRVRGDVLNAVNIQGSKYGGSVAVNLGLHLSFLPVNWSSELPDLSKFKEIDCEFRDRLSPKGRNDYWWKYGGILDSPVKRISHLVATFKEFGEPQFEEFDSVETIANSLSPDEVSSGAVLKVFGDITAVRAALVMARVNNHCGRPDLAREFANAGLKNLGRAISLKPALEALANAN